MKKLLLLAMAVILTAALAGCGGGDDPLTVGPGLVEIDDSSDATAPFLEVTYTDPSVPGAVTVDILSDSASDGDIAFDPVANSFSVTLSPPTLLFGLNHSDPDIPEFRTFLTFPLDGITGQPAIPGTATIVTASVFVLVDQVSFFNIIPTFLDLVQYPIVGTTLSLNDFNSNPLDFRTLDFFSDDPGLFVQIEVTPFMQRAQLDALLDLQVRFLVDTGAAALSPRAPAKETARSVHVPSTVLKSLAPRRAPSTAKSVIQLDKSSRHR
jgi:hypothetical protein